MNESSNAQTFAYAHAVADVQQRFRSSILELFAAHGRQDTMVAEEAYLEAVNAGLSDNDPGRIACAGSRIEVQLVTTDVDYVSHEGTVTVDADEGLSLCIQRRVRQDDGSLLDFYKPDTVRTLIGEWPQVRALLLNMIAEADRVLPLLPAALPVPTRPAPVAAVPPARPSKPARRGPAGQGRRGASSRSRGD